MLCELVSIKSGVFQSDEVMCVVFIIVLEKVVRDDSLSMRGNVFWKAVQILAYADDASKRH
jgi:hypothetical protein